MLTKSTNHNPNYLAKIVKLKGLRKHGNADRLQCVDIDFQNVITGMDAKEGDVYVYFPIECQINSDFLKATNSFRVKEMNADPEKAGFFEENGRVKAMKLRGEKSMGYMVPVSTLEDFAGVQGLSGYVNTEFDTIGNILLLKKYVIKTPEVKSGRQRQGKTVKVSRLIENQFRLHTDSENLRKNIHKLTPESYVSISYKLHGTSAVIGNILVQRRLKWYEKILKKLGVKIQDTEYDLIYSSRKVVKNDDINKDGKGFYSTDVWGDVAKELEGIVPKGFTLYGEIVGHQSNGQAIQKGYDYGCAPNQKEFYVYRITQTNADGICTELSWKQLQEFCERKGLKYPKTFFVGKLRDLYPWINEDENWHSNVLKKLEQDYNEKDCQMCKNRVPEEGIVLKEDSLFKCEPYKLKSFRFLEFESKALDNGDTDLESNES